MDRPPPYGPPVGSRPIAAIARRAASMLLSAMPPCWGLFRPAAAFTWGEGRRHRRAAKGLHSSNT